MSILLRNKEKDKIDPFSYTSKDKIDPFLYTSKVHSTLEHKKFIPLYAEHLHFLVKRAGRLLTHIYHHYTFEQSKFKKYFVEMNQKSRQTALTSVESDFCELLNNTNFGIDCRNNIYNCILEPLYDDLDEIPYIKKLTTIFSDDA